MRKAILFIVLMLSAQIARADTYPAADSPWYSMYSAFTQTSISSYISAADLCLKLYALATVYDETRCTDNSGGYYVYGTNHSYSCPYGGTVSGSSCINAPSCTASQVRDATTGECKAPAVSCNYTPLLTTVGTTQTIHWQIDGGNNTCTDQSVSCQSPLVANTENKRCDLLCSDGTTANVDSGASCPPPVCVGEQTVNTATNTCQEPVCSNLQVLDTVHHICLDNLICVGGQTRNTSTLPYSCDDPVCTGIKILDTSSHICIDPPPAVCVGSQTLDVATNSCVDPVCPSGYHLNADKVCEVSRRLSEN
jgi:hypothetical protein